MRGIYCGHAIDTDIDEAVATAHHEDGTATLYVTRDGRYYFLVGGRIGFMEPEDMRRWVADSFEEYEAVFDRVGRALPVCSRGGSGVSYVGMTRRPGAAWYLLPVFLGLVGGVVMYFGVRGRDRAMAGRGMIVGGVLSGITILWLMLSGL